MESTAQRRFKQPDLLGKPRMRKPSLFASLSAAAPIGGGVIESSPPGNAGKLATHNQEGTRLTTSALPSVPKTAPAPAPASTPAPATAPAPAPAPTPIPASSSLRSASANSTADSKGSDGVTNPPKGTSNGPEIKPTATMPAAIKTHPEAGRASEKGHRDVRSSRDQKTRDPEELTEFLEDLAVTDAPRMKRLQRTKELKAKMASPSASHKNASSPKDDVSCQPSTMPDIDDLGLVSKPLSGAATAPPRTSTTSSTLTSADPLLPITETKIGLASRHLTVSPAPKSADTSTTAEPKPTKRSNDREVTKISSSSPSPKSDPPKRKRGRPRKNPQQPPDNDSLMTEVLRELLNEDSEHEEDDDDYTDGRPSASQGSSSDSSHAAITSEAPSRTSICEEPDRSIGKRNLDRGSSPAESGDTTSLSSNASTGKRKRKSSAAQPLGSTEAGEPNRVPKRRGRPPKSATPKAEPAATSKPQRAPPVQIVLGDDDDVEYIRTEQRSTLGSGTSSSSSSSQVGRSKGQRGRKKRTRTDDDVDKESSEDLTETGGDPKSKIDTTNAFDTDQAKSADEPPVESAGLEVPTQEPVNVSMMEGSEVVEQILPKIDNFSELDVDDLLPPELKELLEKYDLNELLNQVADSSEMSIASDSDTNLSTHDIWSLQTQPSMGVSSAPLPLTYDSQPRPSKVPPALLIPPSVPHDLKSNKSEYYRFITTFVQYLEAKQRASEEAGGSVNVPFPLKLKPRSEKRTKPAKRKRSPVKSTVAPEASSSVHQPEATSVPSIQWTMEKPCLDNFDGREQPTTTRPTPAPALIPPPPPPASYFGALEEGIGDAPLSQFPQPQQLDPNAPRPGRSPSPFSAMFGAGSFDIDGLSDFSQSRNDHEVDEHLDNGHLDIDAHTEHHHHQGETFASASMGNNFFSSFTPNTFSPASPMYIPQGSPHLFHELSSPFPAAARMPNTTSVPMRSLGDSGSGNAANPSDFITFADNTSPFYTPAASQSTPVPDAPSQLSNQSATTHTTDSSSSNALLEVGPNESITECEVLSQGQHPLREHQTERLQHTNIHVDPLTEKGREGFEQEADIMQPATSSPTCHQRASPLHRNLRSGEESSDSDANDWRTPEDRSFAHESSSAPPHYHSMATSSSPAPSFGSYDVSTSRGLHRPIAVAGAYPGAPLDGRPMRDWRRHSPTEGDRHSTSRGDWGMHASNSSPHGPSTTSTPPTHTSSPASMAAKRYVTLRKGEETLAVRVSKQLTFSELKHLGMEHWGLMNSRFRLYDEQGALVLGSALVQEEAAHDECFVFRQIE